MTAHGERKGQCDEAFDSPPYPERLHDAALTEAQSLGTAIRQNVARVHGLIGVLVAAVSATIGVAGIDGGEFALAGLPLVGAFLVATAMRIQAETHRMAGHRLALERIVNSEFPKGPTILRWESFVAEHGQDRDDRRMVGLLMAAMLASLVAAATGLVWELVRSDRLDGPLVLLLMASIVASLSIIGVTHLQTRHQFRIKNNAANWQLPRDLQS